MLTKNPKIMKNLKKYFNALMMVALVGLVGMATSCNVKTNMEDCFEAEVDLRFGYKYDAKEDPNDDFDIATRMEEMVLYIFEKSTGVLAAIIPINSAELDHGLLAANLPVGTYSIVAWGFGGPTYQKGSFIERHLVDGSTGRTVGVEVNKTKLNDFRLLVADSGDRFSNLYHAYAETVVVNPEVNNSKEPTYIDFTFVPYHNTIELKVMGVQYINPTIPRKTSGTRAEPHLPLDIYITAPMGSYTYNGGICQWAPEERFNTRTISLTDTETVAEIRLLRLDVQRHKTNPALLHLHSTDKTRADNHVLPDIDILSHIRQVRDEHGRYLYYDQDDINKEELFKIEINILYNLDVEIKINGFQIIDIDPEV